MKLAVGSVTYSGSHSLMMVQRHVLDWRLQTDPRWRLSLLSDGPWEAREDRLTPNELDFGPQVEFIEYPKRRKAWGAYCRKDWLETLDPEEYPYVLFCSADDQIISKYVETIFREMEDGIDSVFYLSPHWHYGHKPIPMGVFPAISRCDWISSVWRTSIAKKVGITDPEEYACDGIYHSQCFNAINNDGTRIKILDNFLVVKN